MICIHGFIALHCRRAATGTKPASPRLVKAAAPAAPRAAGRPALHLRLAPGILAATGLPHRWTLTVNLTTAALRAAAAQSPSSSRSSTPCGVVPRKPPGAPLTAPCFAPGAPGLIPSLFTLLARCGPTGAAPRRPNRAATLAACPGKSAPPRRASRRQCASTTPRPRTPLSCAVPASSPA